jgi:hypothetical protein
MFLSSLLLLKTLEIFGSLVLNISKPLFSAAMTQDHAKNKSTVQRLYGYRNLSSETGSSRALQFQQTISEKGLHNGYRQRSVFRYC